MQSKRATQCRVLPNEIDAHNLSKKELQFIMFEALFEVVKIEVVGEALSRE